jgi:hypothetical protein
MYCTSSLFVFSKKVPRLSRARGDRVVITPQLSARGTRRAGRARGASIIDHAVAASEHAQGERGTQQA